ncbi:MAG: ATP-binding cassette domain-containing protein, partial [Bacteroidales bacterium]|nr:ATP-binding cassette domain-containing protein [Bacteroidales bacterium]
MIKINDLNFSYSKTNVFSGLSLTLKEGNVYGLLGQNGVGKTTLLK